ncbi:MAG: flagellar assembly protein FliW [Thermodesulfobacteriota bacterium]
MTIPSQAEPSPVAGSRNVETSRFGAIDIDDDKIITMTSPVLGFPESRHFALVPHRDQSPFCWLQSLDEPHLAFVVIRAAALDADYHPAIDSQARRELGLSRDIEADLLVILTIPHGQPQRMTANLLAPIVVNVAKRLAKQVVLDPGRFDPCWPMFKADETAGL